MFFSYYYYKGLVEINYNWRLTKGLSRNEGRKKELNGIYKSLLFCMSWVDCLGKEQRAKE